MIEDQASNPLLAKARMPGTTFRLPSQGVFYDNGELRSNVKNGEVEVFPLTSMDEIVLSTPDKLLSGNAIPEVFMRCIPDVLKPNELLARDVDYLMVCLRLATFGPQLDVSWMHDCANAKTHEYAVDLQGMIQSTRSVDPTKVDTEYSLTLENGQVVVLKPMTQANIVELMQTAAFNKSGNVSQEEAEMMIVNTLSNVIKRVDETTNPIFIRQWVATLNLKWKRQIERTIQTLSQWGVDFETHHVCKDCGEQIVIPISPNPVSFFT